MIKRKKLVLLIIGAMLIGAILPSYLLFGWENIYYNDDYAVRIPGGWTYTTKSNILMLRPRLAIDPLKPSIAINKAHYDTPIDLKSFNFTKQAERQFALQYQKYETVYWGFRDIGDKEYVLLEFTGRRLGVSFSACAVFYLTNNNDVYTILLLNNSTEKNQKEFYRVVESLRTKIPE